MCVCVCERERADERVVGLRRRRRTCPRVLLPTWRAPRHGRFVWLLVGPDGWNSGAEDDDVLAKNGRMSSNIATSVVRAHERVIDAMVLERGCLET